MIEIDLSTVGQVIAWGVPILAFVIITFLNLWANCTSDAGLLNEITIRAPFIFLGIVICVFGGHALSYFAEDDVNQVHEKIEVVENRGEDKVDEKEEIIELKRKLERQEQIIEKLLEMKINEKQ